MGNLHVVSVLLKNEFSMRCGLRFRVVPFMLNEIFVLLLFLSLNLKHDGYLLYHVFDSVMYYV